MLLKSSANISIFYELNLLFLQKIKHGLEKYYQ